MPKKWTPVEPLSRYRDDLGITVPLLYGEETIAGWDDKKLDLAHKLVNGWWNLFGPNTEHYNEFEHHALTMYYERIVREKERRKVSESAQNPD